jgi:HPt (histidine-containing phosphotransfer) domain-containing protein
MSTDDEQKSRELAKAIQALGVTFIARIPTTLSGMQDELNAIEKNAPDHTAWKTLHRHLHSLAGSAGTFGHHELGDRARELEHRIHDMLSTDGVSSELVRSTFIQDQHAFIKWVNAQFVQNRPD